MRVVSKIGHTRKDRAVGKSFHLAKGCMRCSLSDAEFLKTLASYQCFIVPPYVLRARPTGGLQRIADLRFDHAGNLDKEFLLMQIREKFDASLDRNLSHISMAGSRFLHR